MIGCLMGIIGVFSYLYPVELIAEDVPEPIISEESVELDDNSFNISLKTSDYNSRKIHSMLNMKQDYLMEQL